MNCNLLYSSYSNDDNVLSTGKIYGLHNEPLQQFPNASMHTIVGLLNTLAKTGKIKWLNLYAQHSRWLEIYYWWVALEREASLWKLSIIKNFTDTYWELIKWQMLYGNVKFAQEKSSAAHN